MKTALNKRTMQYVQKIEDEDIGEYPTNDWIIDAEKKSAVNNIPRKYWKIVDGKMAVKTPNEKMATDLSNPAPETILGVTKTVNNPTMLKIVNGIITEAS